MATIEQYNPQGERVSRAAIAIAQQCLSGEIPPIVRNAYVAWRSQADGPNERLTSEQIEREVREAAIVFISGQTNEIKS